MSSRRLSDDSGLAATPKYRQLQGLLSDLIAAELRPGDAIASERELMKLFGVSRATVRSAIGELVRQGTLERRQGKGSFVTEHRVISRLHLASFSDDMHRRGLQPTTAVLDSCSVEADEGLAAELLVDVGAACARIERLRIADDRPMAHEIGHYPLSRLPGLLDQDLTQSLYGLLREFYRRGPDGGEQRLWAESASWSRARLLEVKPGSPLLVFQRRATSTGVPIEHTTSWYRADRYLVTMSLETG